MSLRISPTPMSIRRPGKWAAALARAALADPAASNPALGAASALIVFAAAVPFAGWTLPAIWLAAMLVLALSEAVWPEAGPKGPDAVRPCIWLTSAGYSLAGLYLTIFHTGAAQTLGVTLFGVVMFQILARDYERPRRLWLHLTAPLLAVVTVQVAAGADLLLGGEPWRLVTLLASPYVVYRALRAVHHNLDGSRRQAEAALAQLGESEARYRQLAERSPDIIIRYDVEGRLEYLSPAASRYAADPSDLIGRNVREFLDPCELDRNAAFLQDLAAGQPAAATDQSVWRTWTPDGELIFLEGATSPISDDDGRHVGAMAILRDVTARVALEDELRRKTAEAEAATVAKSQFLANMSHEIRTPLTGVIGFARLLRTIPGLPADAGRYASRIHTSADALLAVVNDVLDFSKLEADQVQLDPQPLDPRAFVEEIADLVRDQAAAKGLSLTLETDHDLPAWIAADGARLRQIALNLLTNAVKFTAEGGVTISAETSSDRSSLRIAVRDTGIGVPAEVAGRLFQRFSQVDGSATRQHGGTGLGLAISKGLVEIMGGRIGVESTPGVGSTFWFTIPIAHATAPAETAVSDPTAGAELSAIRILMVDDVSVNRELVAAMLEPFDLTVVEAASGAAAVEAALHSRFDLILMDLQMPGMDGLAATAAIRANCDLNRLTPIVALSANILPEQVQACLAGGMNDHIGKPIDAGELLGAIGRWAARRDAA
ncbi:ATP-binding protein [Phenylobacterium sp. SCN 70-31]|uniref:ATP-binding protein n=1 Tax=Phenylobacterium sp. SCN 70-31 TaxID=1660129 RepID=UPI000AC783DE|nr:ATP-binding protein [Phenylobacterium sp. SCN 70-31]